MCSRQRVLEDASPAVCTQLFALFSEVILRTLLSSSLIDAVDLSPTDLWPQDGG